MEISKEFCISEGHSISKIMVLDVITAEHLGDILSAEKRTQMALLDFSFRAVHNAKQFSSD